MSHEEEKATQLAQRVPAESDAPEFAESGIGFAGERDLARGDMQGEIDRLAAELEVSRLDAERSRDLLLRERAELENFKKRMQRERSEAVRFACEPLIRELLPAIDNLERAIEHAEGGGDGQALVDGVRLVLKGAVDLLDRHGVQRIDTLGEPFDPSRHEAVAQVPDSQRGPNQVVRQFLPGYYLHGRLLRAAQVGVSVLPVEKASDDD